MQITSSSRSPSPAADSTDTSPSDETLATLPSTVDRDMVREYSGYLDQTSFTDYATPPSGDPSTGASSATSDTLPRGGALIPRWTGPQAQEAARQWSNTMDLVHRGEADERPEVRRAAADLERDAVAQQQAFLVEAVHDHRHRLTPPIGWQDISDDAPKLERFGLTPADLKLPGSGLAARLFEPDAAIFGHDLKPTLAFERTDIPRAKDWSTNVAQAFNLAVSAPQYERAVQIGNQIRQHGAAGDLYLAGHSLGGGLAAAAATASGATAFTFGAAGLHPATVTRYGGTPQPRQIYSYRVDGDALINMQNKHANLPKDVGTRFDLPATSASPFLRHFIEDYWSGLARVVGQGRMNLDIALNHGTRV
ncbi:hypothetical protein QCE63_20640 [Caballeronia sp. LZ065]|uniref:hypothetical protein n=1 Tax=Caballeronia sp. LZ065 TaxID=3038571 RepID=UPI0028568CBA|nr:hypothetical protein [Caballeronia sp. LZ065]MDR5781811.1 hypothetical protein [Caballeronia sp. LZ065]